MVSWPILAIAVAFLARRFLRSTRSWSLPDLARPRMLPLVLAAGTQVALVFAPIAVPRPVGAVLVVASLGVAAWWVVRVAQLNRLRPRLALSLLLAGIAMNAAVVLANGYMPVSVAADREVHNGVPDDDHVESGKHGVATSETRLRWLGDTMVTPGLGSPLPSRIILSPGDLLLLMGLAALLLTMPGVSSPTGPRASAADARQRR